jgi:hypothetical protein
MSQGRTGRQPGGKPVLTEEVQAKELQVLKLRRAGMTYDAIAASQWRWPPGEGETRRLYSDRSAAHKAAVRIGERRAKLWGLDHADGIAERLVQLEADKVRLMAVALVATLDEMGITEDEIRTRFKRIFVRHLRALPTVGSSEDDEGDDGAAGVLVPTG